MDSTLSLLVIVNVSSYIVIGIVFAYFMKSTVSSPEQRLLYLEKITRIATSSVEMRYPGEHPKSKKQRIEQLEREIMQEMQRKGQTPFTIDALNDEWMLTNDTNPSLRAIRYSETPTEQVRLQQTPPLGMRQKAILRGKMTGLLT